MPPVRNQAVALPSEVLLDVVRCLSHDNIVILTLVGKAFRELAEHYASTLAARSLRIKLGQRCFEIRIGYQMYILSCCPKTNCTNVLCTEIHTSELLRKIRNIVGFDSVEKIETSADYWSEEYLQCVSHNLQSLRRTTRLLLSTCSEPSEKDNLLRCVDYFTSLERLTISVVSSSRAQTPFAWDIVERPVFWRLQKLDLRLQPVDYRNPSASEEDEEAVVRHLTALVSMAMPQTLWIRGIALSEGVSEALCQIVNASSAFVSVGFETLAKLRCAGSVVVVNEEYAEYEFHRSDNKASDVVLAQYESLRGRFYYFLTNDSAAAKLPNLRKLRYALYS